MTMLGRFEAAIAPAKMVIDLEPLDVSSWTVLAQAHIANQQLPAAILAARRALEISQKSPWAVKNLGLALIYSGQSKEALAVNRGLPADWRFMAFAIAEYRLGHDAEWRLALQEAVRDHAYRQSFRIAMVYAVCGMRTNGRSVFLVGTCISTA